MLTVMRQLVFDAPLPWTSDSLYGWFVSSIRGIRIRGDRGTSFCCDPDGIINIQAQNLAALRYPSDFRYVGKLMVLFMHEARHNNGFSHTCFVNLGTGPRPETGRADYLQHTFLSGRLSVMVELSPSSGPHTYQTSVLTQGKTAIQCEQVEPGAIEFVDQQGQTHIVQGRQLVDDHFTPLRTNGVGNA